MMTFEEWIEKFNEEMFGNKHGGYNACDFDAPNSRRNDMEAAFNAGMLAAAEIVEGRCPYSCGCEGECETATAIRKAAGGGDE